VWATALSVGSKEAQRSVVLTAQVKNENNSTCGLPSDAGDADDADDAEDADDTDDTDAFYYVSRNEVSGGRYEPVSDDRLFGGVLAFPSEIIHR
jgi:hypothetical protein